MSLCRSLGRACFRWALLLLLSLFSKSPHIKLGIRDKHFQTLFFSRTNIPQTETQYFVSLPLFHVPSVLSVMQLSPISCQFCLLLFTTEHVWEAKQPSGAIRKYTVREGLSPVCFYMVFLKKRHLSSGPFVSAMSALTPHITGYFQVPTVQGLALLITSAYIHTQHHMELQREENMKIR